MLMFYLIAGGLALLAAIVLVRPLIAGRTEADGRDARDAQVFRDQLSEIERDLARGTITAEEAEGARVEVSRRLIAADQRARRVSVPRPAPQVQSGLVAGLALIGTPALAVAIYLGVGAPGVPDQPLAERSDAAAALGGAAASSARPAQAEAEEMMAGRLPEPGPADAGYAEMIGQLEKTLESRPDDVEGNRLLANGYMNLGRYAEGWRAYDRLIGLLGGQAGADIHAAKAEGMILATGGYVSPEAEAEIATALKLEPSLPIARYYGGLALRQAGRVDEAIAMWQALRRDSPPDAPYRQWLDVMLAETMRARTGTPPGPTDAEIAAAEQLSPEERAAMAADMVRRLDDRLSRQGGTAEEWARLVASYATLGRMEAASDAYERALAALGDDPEAVAVRAQAARFGIGAGPGTAGPASGPQAAAPAAPGPSAADVDAAARMSPDERAAMIGGMVARLESRLTSEGGSAEEWLRLINAHVQLGNRDEAARAYQLAAAALAGDPAAGFVKEQALLMGVAVE